MLFFRHHLVSLMVIYCTATHFSWAIIILIDPTSSVGATPISSLYSLFLSQQLLALVLLIVAGLAVCAECTSSFWTPALLLPQQFILFWTLSAIVKAIWLGEYADGTIRPSAHIAADQINHIWAALGHMAAVIAHVLRNGRSF